MYALRISLNQSFDALYYGLLMFCYAIKFAQCFTLHFLADSYLSG